MVTRNTHTVRLVYVILLCCFTMSTQADSVARWIKISSDATDIYLGGTLILEIESTGLHDPIELDVLEKSGTFVRETVGTRIAVINQKVVEIALRRMEFQPQELGTHIIGPLRAGEIASNSVFVNVLPAVNHQWQPESDDLQINVTLSNQEPWIHSRLQLDIDLLHRYPLTDEAIELPRLNDFTVRNIYTERRVFTDALQQQRKTSWRYLLFPKTSGASLIGQVAWSGTLIKSRTERAIFERISQPIEINVKPTPLSGNDWWLPATQLKLSESWSQPATSLKAGDEITRTIVLNASGILSGQLPEPQILESRALTQTLINTHRREEIIGNDVHAEAQFIYRVRAQSPIPVFLDTVRIPWWNTHSDSGEEAIIPARRINVGLPERADLLRDLALGTSTAVAFKEWLLDQKFLRWLLTFTGALALCTWVIFNRLRLRNRILHAYSRWNTRKKLHDLNTSANWQALYLATSNLAKQGKITNSESLLAELQQMLFSASATADETRQARLASSIDDLIWQQVRPAKTSNSLAAL